MTKATTLKTITLTAVFAVASSISGAAFAHDTTNKTDVAQKQINISKANARNLVNTLLKREYGGDNFRAGATKKIGDKWRVIIKNRTQTVATALVDKKTGNIHIK